MTTTIRCIGLGLGLVDTRGARTVLAPDAALLKRLRPAVESRGGVLAEDSGSLCALFREVGSALECAVAIFELLESIDSAGPAPSTQVARVAIESGEIELAGKQLRGGLRETLVTLLAHTPNLSIVVGGISAGLLEPGWSSRTRPLSSAAASESQGGSLEGAVEMPWRIEATTHQEATVLAGNADAANGALFTTVELIVGGLARRLQASDCPCTIGRDTRCNVVLSSGEASRLHATIEYEQNRFHYVDNSRNGSYVLTSAGEELFVHHERLWLVGRGAISAGSPVMHQSGELVRFVCEPYRSDATDSPGRDRSGLPPGEGTTIRVRPR